jgi:diacylglycerol kinase
MRMYEVNFAHRTHGKQWSRRIVAVKGYALSAIRKALKQENDLRTRLYVESVHLIAEEA